MRPRLFETLSEMTKSDRLIKVLMFGWEFPPHNSGGLGTACLGLARALGEMPNDIDLTFVLPRKQEARGARANFVFADSFLRNLKIRTVDTILAPYLNTESYSERYLDLPEEEKGIYGASLFEEVQLYVKRAKAIAESEDFDVIHAHDWLSFGAGLVAKEVSGKPLVVHIHATEFDRTGGTGANEMVFNMEKQGMEFADKVIAVSHFTKKIVVEKYGIPEEKVEVVHNGTDATASSLCDDADRCTPLDVLKTRGSKIVLFVGRITLQKGPEYFLRAAKRVLEYEPNTIFVVAGSGDMHGQMMRETAALGISKNVLFAGFLRGSELEQIYRAADLYVMPSVSEPFGLTALEAVENGTPVLLSKQSGVSEVIRHALSVDFWDTDEMANKIVSVLRYNCLGGEMKRNARKELLRLSWDNAAKKCRDIYRSVVTRNLKSMK